ncbi:unnamed protein product [Durusdinium trenchii]|uniref:Uncharacterized protein n=1 Tax=Durusdinium trenchii TaxID=1381693 RepID=A0ABP0NGR6_9DINO
MLFVDLRLGKKHVAGEVSPPITDHSAPSESHGERMARSSLKKAAESLPEMDRVLGQLPKAVKEFTTAYSELSSDALLEGPPNLDPAKALRQVGRSGERRRASDEGPLIGRLAFPRSVLEEHRADHAVDIGRSPRREGMALAGSRRFVAQGVAARRKRTSIHPEQAEKLCKIFVEPLNVMQVVVSEVSFGIVKCLKEILRQAITPMLSSDERQRPAGRVLVRTGLGAEEGSTLCGAVADLMQAAEEAGSADVTVFPREQEFKQRDRANVSKHRHETKRLDPIRSPSTGDDASNNIPIQALECAWASSALLNELTVMLIREVLGFHADIAPQVGASGASPIYALAGCVDFDHATEKNCGSQETQIHVSVDSWVGSYASAQNNFAKEYPRIAAEDLGSMGYSGEESMYVSQEILHAAYSESGLALDFYKSYFAEGSRIAGIADCDLQMIYHKPPLWLGMKRGAAMNMFMPKTF